MTFRNMIEVSGKKRSIFRRKIQKIFVVLGVFMGIVGTVQSVSAAELVKISATPMTVIKGQATKISWNIRNADSCEFSKSGGTWMNIPEVSASLVESPQSDTTYLVRCKISGNNGTQSDSVLVRVQESAQAPCIPDNSCSATTCTGSTCQNNCNAPVGGLKICAATVKITDFQASPSSTIYQGDGTRLYWTSTGADACTLSGSSVVYGPSDSGTVSPSVDTVYQLTCYANGPKGKISATKSITVKVLPLPPISQPNSKPLEIITVNGVVGDAFHPFTTVSSGGEVTVAWHHDLIGACILYGSANVTALGYSGSAPNTGSKEYTLTAPGTYDFRMSCAKGSWSGVGVRVFVPIPGISITRTSSTIGPTSILAGSPPPPVTDPLLISSFTVNTNFLPNPGPVTLSWQASLNATKCVASGGWDNNALPLPGGSLVIQNVNTDSTFYLECFNTTGVSSGERALMVSVAPTTADPTLITSFTVDKNFLPGPGPVTLSWKASASATKCVASGGWDNNALALPSGSFVVPSVNSTTAFYLECFNTNGISSSKYPLSVSVGTVCVDDNLCTAATTCSGQTCMTNCGVSIVGTKACQPFVSGTCIDPLATCEASCTSGQIPMEYCGAPNRCCKTPPVVIDNQTASVANPLGFNNVQGVLDKVLSSLQAIIVVLAMIAIVIGGILYITASGDEGRLKTAKGAITAALVGLALGIAAPSFLKQIGDILGWGAIVPPVAKTLSAIAMDTVNFLLSLVGVIGIIMLVVGGLMYLTSAGDEKRIETAKAIVKYALIGIAIALASLVLATQVAGFFN